MASSHTFRYVLVQTIYRIRTHLAISQLFLTASPRMTCTMVITFQPGQSLWGTPGKRCFSRPASSVHRADGPISASSGQCYTTSQYFPTPSRSCLNAGSMKTEACGPTCAMPSLQRSDLGDAYALADTSLALPSGLGSPPCSPPSTSSSPSTKTETSSNPRVTSQAGSCREYGSLVQHTVG